RIPQSFRQNRQALQCSPHMKTTPASTTNSMNRSYCPLALLLIPLAFACFGLAPQARAVCQEGCFTNQNTVLGDNALLTNMGMFNTAIGSTALLNNTGSYNTATGSNVLLNNTTGLYNTAVGHAALVANTTASDNTAIGFETL